MNKFSRMIPTMRMACSDRDGGGPSHNTSSKGSETPPPYNFMIKALNGEARRDPRFIDLSKDPRWSSMAADSKQNQQTRDE